MAGADSPVAGIAAVVDTEADHTVVDRTGAAVDHMQVAHTAVAEVAEDIVVDRTEIVVDRMQVAHTAAAVVGIAQSA